MGSLPLRALEYKERKSKELSVEILDQISICLFRERTEQMSNNDVL